MEMYISKSALVAEIEMLQAITMDEDGNFYTAKAQAEYNVLCWLESFLDTLEVKDANEALRTEYEKGRADAIAEIQKEWSEEDEKMCQETIDWFEKKCFPYALESENPARESIKWLKSLKQRIKGE